MNEHAYSSYQKGLVSILAIFLGVQKFVCSSHICAKLVKALKINAICSDKANGWIMQCVIVHQHTCRAQLSVRKLGSESGLLRTSQRGERFRPAPPSTQRVRSCAPPAAVTGGRDDEPNAPGSAVACRPASQTPLPAGDCNGRSPNAVTPSEPATAACRGRRVPPEIAATSLDGLPHPPSGDRRTGTYVDRSDDRIAVAAPAATSSVEALGGGRDINNNICSGSAIPANGGVSVLPAACAPACTAGGATVGADRRFPDFGHQSKLLWKLVRVARRWYGQLREDFSEMRPFEIAADKPLIAVDDMSIRDTTEILNRFNDLFAALVDGPLRDAYNETLRMTQWTYPLQTLLLLLVLVYSLWSEYLLPLIFLALCVSLARNYMVARGWIVEKYHLDYEARRRSNAVRVTNLLHTNLRVMKTFQVLTDQSDKALALWTWKRPEITSSLMASLAVATLVSLVVPAGLLVKMTGTALLAKIFLLDYVFFRFPRVRAKYDLIYKWYNDLPTGRDLDKQRRFHNSLKPSKSTSDLTTLKSADDPFVMRGLEEKLSQLFELAKAESLAGGWELGKRCTLINRDRTLTGGFRSGRLFLTENHLLFMRYKTQSPKNITIALADIERVEKGRHTGWLPSDAQTLEIITLHSGTLTFGALADRDDVHREVSLYVARHANKRRIRHGH